MSENKSISPALPQNGKASTPQKKENLLLSISCNVLLPVLLLEKLSRYIDGITPAQVLLIALAFPISYGVFDYLKTHKGNVLSAFGIINTLLTGGFAFYELEGIWFSIKEASLPLILGIAIFISIFTKKTAITFLAYNNNLFNIETIEQSLAKHNTKNKLPRLLKRCTLLLAISFFISAILNFILAQSIFTPIAHIADEVTRKDLLNSQISQMTWQGFLIIALPLTAFLGFILWNLFSGLKKITGLDFDDLMKTNNQNAKKS